jgi:hypothetical protein
LALNPFTGGPRFATAVVIGLVVAGGMALLHRSTVGVPTPEFDVDELIVQSPAPIERDLIVTGTWTATTPTGRSDLRVTVCGHKGGRAVCYFDIPATDRSRLERRLIASSDVAIRGRCEQVSGGVAVLRDCQLLDSGLMGE